MLTMMGNGHCWAVIAIIALVISTAFLIWLGDKEGNPYRKFGTVIAWIAIALSGLIVLSSIIMCVTSVSKGYWPPCMRGQKMMHSMPDMKMRPGMRRGMGMGQDYMMPPPPSSQEEVEDND